VSENSLKSVNYFFIFSCLLSSLVLVFGQWFVFKNTSYHVSIKVWLWNEHVHCGHLKFCFLAFRSGSDDVEKFGSCWACNCSCRQAFIICSLDQNFFVFYNSHVCYPTVWSNNLWYFLATISPCVWSNNLSYGLVLVFEKYELDQHTACLKMYLCSID
jgi:hypothetical protein